MRDVVIHSPGHGEYIVACSGRRMSHHPVKRPLFPNALMEHYYDPRDDASAKNPTTILVLRTTCWAQIQLLHVHKWLVAILEPESILPIVQWQEWRLS